METEGGGSSDVRWKTVPQTSGYDRKRSDCRRLPDRWVRRTSRLQSPETLMKQSSFGFSVCWSGGPEYQTNSDDQTDAGYIKLSAARVVRRR